MRGLGVMASVVAVMTVLGAAAAAQPAPRPDPPTAADHLQSATTAMTRRDYRGAATAYRHAFDVTRDPSLLFMLGLAHERAGDCATAVAYFQHYLAQPVASAHDRRLAIEHVVACLPATRGRPHLSVSLAPAEPLTPDLAAATGPRNPKIAGGLSAGVTLGGSALVLIGASLANANDGRGNGGEEAGVGVALIGIAAVLVGPSVGHAYAGRVGNTALWFRLAALGTVGLGAMVTARSAAGCGDVACTPSYLLLGAGVLGFGASSVWECATAPDAARAYNVRHASRQLALGPLVGPASGRRGVTAGLQLAGRF